MPVRDRESAKGATEGPMFVTWSNDEGRQAAYASTADALKNVGPVVRSTGSTVFNDIAPNNISIRDGFGREDYEMWRLSEMRPYTTRDEIFQCMRAYWNNGLIRNIIDLMADFTTQGITLYHPNERVEKWWKEWFKRINGQERSERFCNYLYRMGNVLVKRQTAKISVKLEGEMRRAIAAPGVSNPGDAETEPEDTTQLDPYDTDVVLEKREIPWRYSFLNPLSIEILNADLATFAGPDYFQYALKLPTKLTGRLKNPRTPTERAIVSNLPGDIKGRLVNGNRLIPLDMTTIKSFYYKRDDWQLWATPLLVPLLNDIKLLDKMKLADLAALDGAISSIRIWKLGNMEHKILPTEVAFNTLAQILQNNVGGGVMDLIWGPELELSETSTDVHKFLGQAKYQPVMQAIFQGLGIPPTLTGGNGQEGGFTNNFISLRTLTERLEYGRMILKQFWEHEIKLTQKSMGFRFPATIVFDRMVLTDEAAEKKLLIELADRDYISWELLIERFGEAPEIEEARIRREYRKRKNSQLPPKASPFHDPQQDYGKEKLFIQAGQVTPSQVGLELDDAKPGEKTLLEHQASQQDKQSKVVLKGQQQENDHQFRTTKLLLKHGAHPGQQEPDGTGGTPGRPTGSRDVGKRKKKTVKPRTSASLLSAIADVEKSQAKIHAAVAPAFLKSLGKSTARELTEAQSADFEEFKFRLLCQLPPEAEVNDEVLKTAMATELSVPEPIMKLLKTTVDEHVTKTGREPSLEVLRRFQAGVYAMWNTDFGDDDDE